MGRLWASSLIAYAPAKSRMCSMSVDLIRTSFGRDGYSRKFSSAEVISAELKICRQQESRVVRSARAERPAGSHQNRKGFSGPPCRGRVWTSNAEMGRTCQFICFIIICFLWCCYIIHCEDISQIVWIMNIDTIHLSTDMVLSTKYWLFKTCMHCWQFFAFYLSCNPEV